MTSIPVSVMKIRGDILSRRWEKVSFFFVHPRAMNGPNLSSQLKGFSIPPSQFSTVNFTLEEKRNLMQGQEKENGEEQNKKEREG